MKLETRDIQLKTLDILLVVDKIAKELNLKYVLAWGTLIGAIRHKGFIPWDDDLDIMMPRKDYDKLQEYFVAHYEDLLPYVFFSKDTRNEYPYMIGRVCNTDYLLVAENEKNYDMGIFLDIYPMDGAGNGKHKLFYYKACLTCTILGMKTRLHFAKSFSFKKNVIKFILFQISHLLKEEKLIQKLKKYGKKYDYDTSSMICCMEWMDSGTPILFYKSLFDDVIYTKFENYLFPVPKDFDRVLRNYYGDYMQLPPEKQRVGHHYYEIYTKN